MSELNEGFREDPTLLEVSVSDPESTPVQIETASAQIVSDPAPATPARPPSLPWEMEYGGVLHVGRHKGSACE
ncbi:MAG: hypothetical protein A3B10_03460 [Candidatus Doudnabacteria bacterium RIFCSPLOWO2_01_FULL_44_21]|uniref:Uncharacterized protein n=1 Tax=Candidatus Doudnabacteria bacterium RIFCSPLOWO2_01_FULL_44_21 TaxID=1817841 RepID=A0A1F5PY34_9BACT|nr:MAG: hypothetical protein A3B95_02390 [Candidatus Doudnabacteria bacterium RIFCSPHIGHO2_02_FULL_43_13b]OGE94823.1 MAG: hypothetical protein A3B10_03460 [Candidatus Doudnabacteria bacterium RIFCSPLOWO2_01_FULL_44_21]